MGVSESEPHDAPKRTEGGADTPRPIRLAIRAVEWLVIALMAVITATVIAQVGLRWLAGTSLVFHEELTRYLMIWVAMLGSALLVHEDGHIRVTLLPAAAPPWLRRIVQASAHLVSMFFVGALVVAAARAFPDILGQKTVTLGVSTAWFFAALPVGGALMFLISAHAFLRQVVGESAPGIGSTEAVIESRREEGC